MSLGGWNAECCSQPKITNSDVIKCRGVGYNKVIYKRNRQIGGGKLVEVCG